MFDNIKYLVWSLIFGGHKVLKLLFEIQVRFLKKNQYKKKLKKAFFEREVEEIRTYIRIQSIKKLISNVLQNLKSLIWIFIHI